MPDTLIIIYLIYMFLALYFIFLFVLIFLQNRKQMFFVPEIKKEYTVSVLIPAYNEEDSIKETVETVLKSDYKKIIEVIIINDGSSDNTLKIVRQLEKKYPKVWVFDKKNSGKADSLNQAIKIAKGELIAVVDADSYPDINAVSSMVGFFDEKNIGAATTRILVKQKNNFLRKMQAVEYKVIAFTRMLLGFIDAIYVTPGPMAIYRKSALHRIGGFDKKNMTEDIEATWHLIHAGYNIRMSFVAKSTTVAPETLKKWFKQRIRWNIGGYQCLLKYKDSWFKKGMLGFFIIPFFSISLVLGVFGLGVLFYRVIREIFSYYLSTSYSLASQTALLTMQDINLNPTILNFLGVILFITGLAFVYLALKYVNARTREKESFFSVVFYSLVYIILRPIVLIWSLIKMARGNYSWR